MFVSDAEMNAQYDYPRPLLRKAFEHLCAFGLVSMNRESKRALPPDKLPLLLRIDSHTLHEYVKAGKNIPTVVQRFGTSWTN